MRRLMPSSAGQVCGRSAASFGQAAAWSRRAGRPPHDSWVLWHHHVHGHEHGGVSHVAAHEAQPAIIPSEQTYLCTRTSFRTQGVKHTGQWSWPGSSRLATGLESAERRVSRSSACLAPELQAQTQLLAESRSQPAPLQHVSFRQNGRASMCSWGVVNAHLQSALSASGMASSSSARSPITKGPPGSAGRREGVRGLRGVVHAALMPRNACGRGGRAACLQGAGQPEMRRLAGRAVSSTL